MLRFRFTSGVILGLVIGLPVGVLIGLLVLPPRPDPAALTSLEVQDMRRKLEAATYAKDRAERQMEQFQKLAEQMTASFSRLEERFTMLGEQAQGAAAPTPALAIVPPPVPTPTVGPADHDTEAPPDTP
jgi:hypothetical protein